MNAQSKSNKPLVIGAAVVLSLVVMCCCSGAVGVYVMGKQGREEAAARFAGLDAACSGQPVAGTAAVAADGTIRVQVYDEDMDILTYWLPSEMYSTELADTEAVVCRVGEQERYEIERCDYETGIVTGLTGGQNVIVREGYRVRYRLVAAQTGETIAEELVPGELPEACPETADFDTGGETDRFSGGIVDGDDVGAWLRTQPL